MNKKKRNHHEDLNFWQPASDMFSALLLILMLVILLLGLYLVHIPEHTQVDPWAGDSFIEGADDWDDKTGWLEFAVRYVVFPARHGIMTVLRRTYKRDATVNQLMHSSGSLTIYIYYLSMHTDIKQSRDCNSGSE